MQIYKQLGKVLDIFKWFGLRKIYYLAKHFVETVQDKLIEWNLLYPSYNQSLIKRGISKRLINNFSGDSDTI